MSNNRRINIYNLALLSLQGYKIEEKRVIKRAGLTRLAVYMRKENRLEGEKLEMGFDLFSLDSLISARKYSEEVSKNFDIFAKNPANGLKLKSNNALRPFIKAQSPEDIIKNIENGSFAFNVEKMFADLVKTDPQLLVDLAINVERELLGEGSHIREELTKDEIDNLREGLKHLNEVVRGKEPTKTAKIERTRSR